MVFSIFLYKQVADGKVRIDADDELKPTNNKIHRFFSKYDLLHINYLIKQAPIGKVKVSIYNKYSLLVLYIQPKPRHVYLTLSLIQ